MIDKLHQLNKWYRQKQLLYYSSLNIFSNAKFLTGYWSSARGGGFAWGRPLPKTASTCLWPFFCNVLPLYQRTRGLFRKWTLVPTTLDWYYILNRSEWRPLFVNKSLKPKRKTWIIPPITAILYSKRMFWENYIIIDFFFLHRKCEILLVTFWTILFME